MVSVKNFQPHSALQLETAACFFTSDRRTRHFQTPFILLPTAHCTCDVPNMNIDKLPRELLLLIIANLRVRDVRSLALTFNKHIFDNCLPLLQLLTTQRCNNKYAASLFPQLSHQDFIDIHSLRHYGSFGDLSHRWIDAWGPIENDQELLRLAVHNPHDPGRAQHYSNPLTIQQWHSISEFARSLEIEMPTSFWDAMSDPNIVDQMATADGGHFKVQEFMLMPAKITRGVIGYMLPFLHHPDEQWSWYLYFEPGREHWHCVLRIDNVMKTTNVDDELMWEVLSNVITDEDREVATLHNVRLEMIDSDNIHLMGFSFREWLAQRLFNHWPRRDGSIRRCGYHHVQYLESRAPARRFHIPLRRFSAGLFRKVFRK